MSKSFEIYFRDNYSVVVKDFTLKFRPENTDSISDYFQLSNKKVRFANIIQDKKIYCCCIEEAENGSHTVKRVLMLMEDISIIRVANDDKDNYYFRSFRCSAEETANRFSFNKDQQSRAEFVTFVYEFRNTVRPMINTIDSMILKRYVNYLANEENLSITLVTDGIEIKANKHHLMVMSNVFKAMFNGKWKEADKIDIEGTTAKALQMFIALIHGKLVFNLDVETALEICILADRYDVRDIGEQVAFVVQNQTTEHNVISVLKVGFLVNYKGLKEAAIHCLKNKPVPKLSNIPDYDCITPEMMEYICGELYQEMLIAE